MTCGGLYLLQSPITEEQGRVLADDFARFTGDRYIKRLVRNEWLLGRPYWELDESFDVNNHYVFKRLPPGSTDKDLQEAVCSFVSSGYDWQHPLWQMMLLDVDGKSYVVWRFHHAITDGQGSTKALLKWTANFDPAVGRAVNRASTDQVAALQFKASAVKGRRKSIAEETKTWFTRAAESIKQLVVLLYSILLYIQNLVWVGILVNTTRRRGPWANSPTKRAQGLPDKQIAWSAPVSLAALRRAKDSVGSATVNDLMVSLLVGALQEALREKGQLKDGHFVFLVPTSYRADRDFAINNQSSGYLLSVPTHIASPVQRALDVNQRIRSITLTSMGKLHGVISNVPGPQKKLMFGPAVIENMWPIGPPNGPQGQNMTILSYGDSVALTLYTDIDKTLSPRAPGEWFSEGDAQRVCELFQAEFDRLVAECEGMEEQKLRDAAKRLGRDRARKLLDDGEANGIKVAA
ncbi:hypothetical protein DFJ74DRAFT_717222 [Hyaloraphidium curvatum]|nr:hypothetical protein DFJ74DRAFT_717222 [Hyaloraphidium curvatum]